MTDPSPDPDASQGDPAQRCAFVAVLGPPNAGKSTLVNQLVGAKVSIVTHKAQTTRTRIRGVAMVDLVGDDPVTDADAEPGTDATPPPEVRAQVVFIDTPGIFQPRKRFDRAMVAAAWDGALEADRTLLVVDARKGLTPEVEAIAARLRDGGRPVLLALNKVDALKDRAVLLDLAARFDALMPFERIFMISALSGSGCRDLLTHLARTATDGPWMFAEDDLSDLPQRLLAAEITREKIYLQLHEELPYAAAVVTDSWQERKDGSVRIDQTILVERDTQRAIVLGKGGARIKALGAAARAELSEMMERPVHLFLHVKVQERLWDSRETYRDWGLDFDAK